MITLRKNMIWASLVLGLVLVTQFQNCGDVGTAPFSRSISSTNCNENPSSCTVNGIGRVEELAINITTGSANKHTISNTSDRFKVQGTCNAGGFRRTTIDWRLTRQNGSVLASGRTVEGCPDMGAFEFEASFPGQTLANNEKLNLRALVIGLDRFDNEFRVPTPANLEVTALEIIKPPILDHRACDTYQGPTWEDVTRNRYYVYSSQGSVVTIGNEDADSGTPRLCGFCQTTTKELGPLRMSFEPLGTFGLPGEPVVRSLEVGNYRTACVRYPDNQRPAGMPAGYDGYFRLNAFPLDTVETGFHGWHTRLSVSVTDTFDGSNYVQESKQVQNIEVHFRNRLPSNPMGRGWSIPMARSALARMKSYVQFQNVANNAALQADARNVHAAGLASANQQASSLRQYTVVEYLKGREGASGSNILLQFDSMQGFPGLIKSILNRSRRCDVGLTGSIPVVPDFDNGGTLADPDSRQAQINMLSVCAVYWFYSGALNRYGDRDLQAVISEGLRYDRGSNRCISAVSGATIGDGAICDYMARTDDNAFRGFITQFANRYIPSGRLSDASDEQMRKFSAAFAQFLLRWVFQGLCSGGINEFWLRVINGAVSNSIDNDRNALNFPSAACQQAKATPKNSPDYGSRLQACMQDFIPRAANLVVIENNGFAEPFKHFATTMTCGSADATGSYTGL